MGNPKNFIVTASALLILSRHKHRSVQLTGCRTTDLSVTILFVIEYKETAAALASRVQLLKTSSFSYI